MHGRWTGKWNSTARCSERRDQKRRNVLHRRSRKGRGASRCQRVRQGRQRDRQNCAPCPSGRSPLPAEPAAEQLAELLNEHCDGTATLMRQVKTKCWSMSYTRKPATLRSSPAQARKGSSRNGQQGIESKKKIVYVEPSVVCQHFVDLRFHLKPCFSGVLGTSVTRGENERDSVHVIKSSMWTSTSSVSLSIK